MTDAQAAILEEIATLLAEPERGPKRPSLARLEDTLTAGYAHALELEAEQWRLERRIGEVTSRIGNGEDGDADELAELAQRASRADGELRRLRAQLATLRIRASALRARGASLFL
jgi:hypothetical protein